MKEIVVMKAVSIINFKGGVGKTTLSYHLAAFLARKQRVLLIDVDHQSSLSIVVLGPKLAIGCKYRNIRAFDEATFVHKTHDYVPIGLYTHIRPTP
jgi:cellulose biosynthesis protein BcsQ